jgi:CDP-glucose 4,6-dehydratase
MLKKLKKFYFGKKVFITGHTGFKGCWMALWLNKLGAEVCAYALPPEDVRGNLFKQIALDSKITSKLGDINDAQNLQKSVSDFKPEIFFHLAAQALVRKSYKNPVETYMSNVIGTANVFEAIRKTDTVKTLVNITTDKCYENKEWVWPYRENDELGGYDPYSSSKACAEIVTSAYRRSFFTDGKVGIATARAGNVIGGGDFSEDRIIPDIVEAIQNNKEVILRNATAIRPWQHVLDAIYGYLVLAMNLHENVKRFEGAYNFSPSSNEVYNVESITKIFIDTIGKGSYKIDSSLANLHEANILKLDPSKAKNLLDWETKFSTKEAIIFTSEWFKNYIKAGDIYNFTLKQLDEYEQKINN